MTGQTVLQSTINTNFASSSNCLPANLLACLPAGRPSVRPIDPPTDPPTYLYLQYLPTQFHRELPMLSSWQFDQVWK